MNNAAPDWYRIAKRLAIQFAVSTFLNGVMLMICLNFRHECNRSIGIASEALDIAKTAKKQRDDALAELAELRKK